jgi:hypothetical protein
VTPGADVLGAVVLALCESAASAWAQGDEATAERLFAGAERVIGEGVFVERCPAGDCDEAAG